MTLEALRRNLLQLIENYVTDPAVRGELQLLVNRNDVPAKGILVDMTPFISGRVTEADSKIIREIAFYFC